VSIGSIEYGPTLARLYDEFDAAKPCSEDAQSVTG